MKGISPFLKKKTLVVGLGKSGVSAARWLSENGAKVTVSDIKSESEMDDKLLKEAKRLGIGLEMGAHTIETFLDVDLIVVSPGVPLQITPLKLARERGIPIIGELELAARLTDTPLIAVTGTNGKSTTTALLGYLIEKAGFKVFVGGNIGTPIMDYVSGHGKADYIVAEVSSFQLDTIEEFSPFVSVLLNISPDHLGRYENYEAYIQSKFRIFQNQGQGQYAVLNDDDERLSRLHPSGKGSVLRYGLEKGENRQAFISQKKIGIRYPGPDVHYFEINGFKLSGAHNIENLMGAILVCYALQIDPQIIQASINQFHGLPHRLEWVGRYRGVDFYDDSKATNVDAAVKAVKGFDRPIVLIAGGRHKGADYLPLVKAAKDRVKKAIFLGEAKHLMGTSFKDIIPFAMADNMQEAVHQAFSSAEPKDVVLLAPACSSFDMFSDYAHRGDVFKAIVRRLDHD